VSVRSSRDAYEVLKQVYNEGSLDHHEEFIILLLNRPLELLGWAKIGVGGITHTMADVRIIFQTALKANAVAIVLSHNHPSGQLELSGQDEIMTARVMKAGNYLDIQVQDHLIITSEGYYSMNDEQGMPMVM
jgi:DNA repair protein RadC